MLTPGDPSSAEDEEQDRINIDLRMPAEGEVSAPLQQVPWQGWDSADIDRERRAGDWWSEGPEHDRGLPRAIKLMWDSTRIKGKGRLVYDVFLKAEDGSQDSLLLSGVEGEQAEVNNLRIGITYSWQVKAFRRVEYGQGLAIGRSQLGHFQTHPAPPRWIAVPGITNVRDIGGWPLEQGGRVRQGFFLRGSEMNAHCDITRPGQRVLVETLRIRTDVDLRGDGEDRRPVLDSSLVEYANFPVASYDMIASPEYTPIFRKLFALLADRSKYPLYLHCWGGADRTGTVAFLLGALLGMRREDLLLDYELTSLSVWGERRARSEPFLEMLETLALFSADGSSLQAQVEHYLSVIGVTTGQISAIRDILIER